MQPAPRWFKPVAIVALLWNLIGCAAFVSDAMLTPEAIANMSQLQQALYAARPSWFVWAYALAVWGGALGCLGLVLRKRWSAPLLLVSLIGVVVQNLWLFGASGAAEASGPSAFVLQGLVLLISVGLVLLSRKAVRLEWVT
ncbi:MAG TPA: hypothetical protein VFV65_01585 [Gemmatimonadales bacterium]|nr:hypothetical protein [Gemmatimonadales bacterium]